MYECCLARFMHWRLEMFSLDNDFLWPISKCTYHLGSLETSAEVLRKKVPGTFHTFCQWKNKKGESCRATTVLWKSAGHSSDTEDGFEHSPHPETALVKLNRKHLHQLISDELRMWSHCCQCVFHAFTPALKGKLQFILNTVIWGASSQSVHNLQ